MAGSSSSSRVRGRRRWALAVAVAAAAALLTLLCGPAAVAADPPKQGKPQVRPSKETQNAAVGSIGRV